MKKIKIFTLLCSAVSLSAVLSIISGCANGTTKNHIWLASVDKPTKDADENLKANYYFGLDADTYTKSDIKVYVKSSDTKLTISKYHVSNNIVVVEMTYTGEVEEKTPVAFSLEFETNNWKQTIDGLVLNIPITGPIDLRNLKKINAILANNESKTMKDALKVVKDNGIDVETLAVKVENGQYVWDQSINRFAIINSVDGSLIYGTDGYVLNTKKWQLWKMVDENSFDSYCEYSQYLKTTTSNTLTKTNYSFISGFDCGNNTDVKNVHYFYENMEIQTAKDIIINTNSINTTVDVSAWDGNSGDGDTVTHYGKSSDLTIVTNYKYVECGKVISASVCDGEVKIESDANIEMTYVRSSNVTLTDYKTSGTIDEIYTDSANPYIKQAIEDQGYTIAEGHDVESSDYQTIKEEAIEKQGGDVSHVFTVTGGAQNEYYETLSDIAAASNASDNREYFEGKTITLNKDYDMAAESLDWTPICNYNDDTGTEAFRGTFDGNGHTILNFNITASGGLVALINTNAGSVKNLSFQNCSVNNTNGKGALISVFAVNAKMEFSNLNFYNCNTTGTTSNGFAMCYVVGGANETTATFKNIYVDEDCWTKGTASGVVQTGFVGQATGGVKELTFEDCELHLAVLSHWGAGAYVGQLGAVNDTGVITATFKNCTSYGDIVCCGTSGNGPMGGGFVGARQNWTTTSVPSTTTFDHCTNYSKVYADDYYTSIDSLGGFIGYGNNPKGTGTIVEFIDCINEGTIGKENTGTSYIPNHAGGFFGRTNGTENITITFTRCQNKGHINATMAGHFMGLLDITTAEAIAARTCTDCTITGSLRDGASRTKITGEPD